MTTLTTAFQTEKGFKPQSDEDYQVKFFARSGDLKLSNIQVKSYHTLLASQEAGV
jgi:hypothetical protein